MRTGLGLAIAKRVFTMNKIVASYPMMRRRTFHGYDYVIEYAYV